jgi:rhodanese-related sulfurtransferase
MKKILKLRNWAILLAILIPLVLPATNVLADEAAVSGKLINGYRVLSVDPAAAKLHLNVYRGDYIKFAFPASMGTPVLAIPDLSVKKKLSLGIAKAPYFKMKKAGLFTFSLGDLSGDITVMEYRQPNYREVRAKQAARLIQESKPLILDVRTKMEYAKGHIENSILIPLQALQARIEEISRYKNQEILVYCATGNRSTVASKIMIDSGFRKITNMRYGIADWARSNYPIIR